MYLQHEESIKRDTNRIREHLIEMARCAEQALKDSLKACLNIDHKLGYTIILRDQIIDEKEKEIDRLCLEFIVKQQPVAHSLRFIFSALKLNTEIERVGDYAESMARHVFKFKEWPEEYGKDDITRLAELSIGMFHDAIQSFIEDSPELAKKTLAVEDTIDSLRDSCINDLLAATKESGTPLALFNIIRRFERVADQARNICMEVIYMCTGEYQKHPHADSYRVLFVDDHNSARGRIAEAIANSLDRKKFIFTSAGLDPRPVDPKTVAFMKEKGFDLSQAVPRALNQIPNLEYYQVIVALSSNARPLFPQEPRKTVYLDWQIDDPSAQTGDEETVRAAYENTLYFLTKQINDLVNAILGASTKQEDLK
jgi:phosphate transport system protein